MTKAPFAINPEDALTWHTVPQPLAGVAERAGFRIRPDPGRWGWQVWATEPEIKALQEQMS